HKSCAFWHTAHAESDLRKKGLVNGVVDARDAVLIVAQKRHRDSFFPGPGFLRKRIISADSVDRRVHLGVDGEVGADATHFRRARARKRHWEKCEQGVSFAEIFAQGDLLWSISRFIRLSVIRVFGVYHGLNDA